MSQEKRAPSVEPTRVLYVYHGSAGIAGAYLHAIAKAISTAPALECHLATNHYWAFEKGDHVTPVFFRLTENTDRNRHLRLAGSPPQRLALRYVELALGYAKLVPYLVRERIDVVNLSVIDDELPTLLFARAVKLLGKRLVVTAHDVVFQGPRNSPSRRRSVFKLADQFVVHYRHVQRELERRVGVPRERIFVQPFPWADITPVIDPAKLRHHLDTFKAELKPYSRVFLVPGVLRPEKGIETLVHAWRNARFPAKERCALVIAGKGTPGIDMKRAVTDLANVTLIERYLTSEEFWALLKLAHVVVLPYAVDWYAHSSVALLAFLAEKPLVASRIPLFETLVQPDTGLLHEPRDVASLTRALEQAARLDADTLATMGRTARERLVSGWGELPEALAALYREGADGIVGGSGSC